MTMPCRFSRRPVVFAAVFFAVAAGIVMYFHYPALMRYFPPCPFHFVTGLHCPGCGATRAAYRLLHGDLAGAARCNLLLLPALGFLLWLCLRKKETLHPAVMTVFIVLAVLFWILRNLPWAPFTLLAPPAGL